MGFSGSCGACFPSLSKEKDEDQARRRDHMPPFLVFAKTDFKKPW